MFVPDLEHEKTLRPWPDMVGSRPEGRFKVELSRIMDITPLDAQLGIWPKQTIPDPLAPLVFGQDGALKGLHSYALLDGAKIDNLPEELANTALPHRCLFKGAAEADWGHVAPWLVALDPDNRLTRRLFTKGAENFGLWQFGPALFLRSAATLGDLWRHLRKFTRVEDETGNWVYFRFWDPVSQVMMHRSQHLAGPRAFFRPLPLTLAPQPHDNSCYVLKSDYQPAPDELPLTGQRADEAQGGAGVSGWNDNPHDGAS
ncbi:DUF4123 domain-containing protein [Paracoccus sp. (in: a-proteobacteria)]|uniref:DUF4123 domain-containing protein n=1 Tax=Paracoccus sp. TaxID=267 RepID=UPI00289C95A7|nr:DUF4123 domain-containing protein [Paracoccus sp. (in: a-proteobacteria)]